MSTQIHYTYIYKYIHIFVLLSENVSVRPCTLYDFRKVQQTRLGPQVRTYVVGLARATATLTRAWEIPVVFVYLFC